MVNPSKPVGYLIHTKKSGLEGEAGVGYNYILCAEGVYIVSRTEYLEGYILIARAQIRGLESFGDSSTLSFRGKLWKPPAALFDETLAAFKAALPNEAYEAYVANGDKYARVLYEQEQRGGAVRYKLSGTSGSVIVDIHSHNTMGAFFSSTDTQDDQGFKVAIVVGRLDQDVPEVRMRLCLYGHFLDWLAWGDVFEGVPAKAIHVLRGPPTLNIADTAGLEFGPVGESRRTIGFAGFKVPLLGEVEEGPDE